MIKPFIATVFASAVILLGACAPAVSGSSVRSAVTWNPVEPLTLNEEGITYVNVDLPPSMFNYDDEAIEASWEQTIRHSSGVGTSQNTNIAPQFHLSDVVAPEGWDVQLERAYLVREVTDRTTQRNDYWETTSTYYNEFFRFTFAVIPSQERSGFLLLTLQSPKGQQAVPMMVGAVEAGAY